MKHKDIIGVVQTARHGFGTNSFKPFCLSNNKDKRVGSTRSETWRRRKIANPDKLKRRWLASEEGEKECLKVLYQQIKKRHMDLNERSTLNATRREKKKIRQPFPKDP